MNKSGRFRTRALNSDEIAGFLSKNAFPPVGCGMNFQCIESELRASLAYCSPYRLFSYSNCSVLRGRGCR
jgi:hypothetical protein